ncbi:hypothetical protein FRC07_008428, partial [Ceratobasidium sp. 392]
SSDSDNSDDSRDTDGGREAENRVSLISVPEIETNVADTSDIPKVGANGSNTGIDDRNVETSASKDVDAEPNTVNPNTSSGPDTDLNPPSSANVEASSVVRTTLPSDTNVNQPPKPEIDVIISKQDAATTCLDSSLGDSNQPPTPTPEAVPVLVSNSTPAPVHEPRPESSQISEPALNTDSTYDAALAPALEFEPSPPVHSAATPVSAPATLLLSPVLMVNPVHAPDPAPDSSVAPPSVVSVPNLADPSVLDPTPTAVSDSSCGLGPTPRVVSNSTPAQPCVPVPVSAPAPSSELESQDELAPLPAQSMQSLLTCQAEADYTGNRRLAKEEVEANTKTDCMPASAGESISTDSTKKSDWDKDDLKATEQNQAESDGNEKPSEGSSISDSPAVPCPPSAEGPSSAAALEFCFRPDPCSTSVPDSVPVPVPPHDSVPTSSPCPPSGFALDAQSAPAPELVSAPPDAHPPNPTVASNDIAAGAISFDAQPSHGGKAEPHLDTNPTAQISHPGLSIVRSGTPTNSSRSVKSDPSSNSDDSSDSSDSSDSDDSSELDGEGDEAGGQDNAVSVSTFGTNVNIPELPSVGTNAIRSGVSCSNGDTSFGKETDEDIGAANTNLSSESDMNTPFPSSVSTESSTTTGSSGPMDTPMSGGTIMNELPKVEAGETIHKDDTTVAVVDSTSEDTKQPLVPVPKAVSVSAHDPTLVPIQKSRLEPTHLPALSSVLAPKIESTASAPSITESALFPADLSSPPGPAIEPLSTLVQTPIVASVSTPASSPARLLPPASTTISPSPGRRARVLGLALKFAFVPVGAAIPPPVPVPVSAPAVPTPEPTPTPLVLPAPPPTIVLEPEPASVPALVSDIVNAAPAPDPAPQETPISGLAPTGSTCSSDSTSTVVAPVPTPACDPAPKSQSEPYAVPAASSDASGSVTGPASNVFSGPTTAPPALSLAMSPAPQSDLTRPSKPVSDPKSTPQAAFGPVPIPDSAIAPIRALDTVQPAFPTSIPNVASVCEPASVRSPVPVLASDAKPDQRLESTPVLAPHTLFNRSEKPPSKGDLPDADEVERDAKPAETVEQAAKSAIASSKDDESKGIEELEEKKATELSRKEEPEAVPLSASQGVIDDIGNKAELSERPFEISGGPGAETEGRNTSWSAPDVLSTLASTPKSDAALETVLATNSVSVPVPVADLSAARGSTSQFMAEPAPISRRTPRP